MLGYFSLMPNIEPELPELLQMLRDAGCMVVLETAGSGGTLDALAPSLPTIDVYIPSYEEAAHQTDMEDPAAIVKAYRTHGATGVVGVKLGADGAVISPTRGELLQIDPVTPPGPVVDTTGAGDAFLAGYVAGMLKGLCPRDSGRLAAATGACCVSDLGASAGLRDYIETAQLAGIS
jgi:sugar/nucleoside kinase (ribokinase family)